MDERLNFFVEVHDTDLRRLEHLLKTNIHLLDRTGSAGMRGGAQAARGMNLASRAADRLERHLRSVQRRGLGLSRIRLGGFGLGGAAIASSLAYGGFAVAKLGLGFLALKEKSLLAFTTLFRSGKTAMSLWRQLTQLAPKTPFRLQDLVSTTQQLAAYGFKAKQITPLIRILSDQMAGLGSGENLGSVVLALGQIHNKGKLMSEELRQLANAGVPALEYLAKGLGKKKSEVMTMIGRGGPGLDGDQAVRLILQGMKGRTGGLAAKQALTFSGLTSNFLDYGQQAAGALMEGFFPKVKTDMKKLTHLMSDPKHVAQLRKIGHAASDYVMPRLHQLVSWLRQNWPEIKKDFRTAASLLRAMGRAVHGAFVWLRKLGHMVPGGQNTIFKILAAGWLMKKVGLLNGVLRTTVKLLKLIAKWEAIDTAIPGGGVPIPGGGKGKGKWLRRLGKVGKIGGPLAIAAGFLAFPDSTNDAVQSGKNPYPKGTEQHRLWKAAYFGWGIGSVSGHKGQHLNDLSPGERAAYQAGKKAKPHHKQAAKAAKAAKDDLDKLFPDGDALTTKKKDKGSKGFFLPTRIAEQLARAQGTKTLRDDLKALHAEEAYIRHALQQKGLSAQRRSQLWSKLGTVLGKERRIEEKLQKGDGRYVVKPGGHVAGLPDSLTAALEGAEARWMNATLRGPGKKGSRSMPTISHIESMVMRSKFRNLSPEKRNELMAKLAQAQAHPFTSGLLRKVGAKTAANGGWVQINGGVKIIIQGTHSPAQTAKEVRRELQAHGGRNAQTRRGRYAGNR